MNIINLKAFLCRFIVIATILLAYITYAQDSDASSNIKYNFRKGLWALQFQIDNNFTLSSFQGGTISAKVHTSNKSAIRFGLSMSGQYGNDKQERINRDVEESLVEFHEEVLTLNLQYIHYPSADKRAKFFYGFGPLITGSHQSTISPSSSRIIAIGAGLSIIFGAEYIISAHLGLTAEYGTIMKYVWTYNRYTSAGHTYKYTGKDIIVNTNTVKFGVSVYL